MLGYVKHQHSLVSKGKKPATTSPSPPVTAVTTAPIVSLPALSFSEDRIRRLMHSMFQDFMQSGSLGINQPSTAPPAVPDSATKITEATEGLRSVTPVEAPSAESPGVVLPTIQEDISPPAHTVSVCVSYVARSGVSNVGGSLSSGIGLTLVFHAVRTICELLMLLLRLLFLLLRHCLLALFSSPFLILVLPLFLLLPPLILFLCLLLLFHLPLPWPLLRWFQPPFSSSSPSRLSFSSDSSFFLGFGPSSSPSPWLSSSYSFGLVSSSLFLFALCLLYSFVCFFPSSCLCFLFGRPGCLSCCFLLFLFGLRFVSGFGFGFVSGLSIFGALIFSVWGF